MKKNDGYKKIKSLFYIVAIISMIIAIVGKVRAEGLPDYVVYYVGQDDIIQTIKNTNSDVLDAYNRALNLGYYLRVAGNRYNSGYITYIFTDYDGLRFCTTNFSSSYYAYPAYIFNSSDTIYSDNNQGFTLHMIAFNAYQDGNGNYRLNFVRESYYTFNNGSHVNNSWSTNLIYNYETNYTNPEFNFPRSNQGCIAYGDFYGLSGSSTSDSIAFKVDNFLSPYDDNFIIYKSYGVGGINDPLLNIQYAEDIFSQGYTYTSSTIYNLTFDVDGTETTVSISSSAYPDDFFENGSFRTSFDLIYRMLSNKIVNFSSADTVILTAVSMSATAYPTSNQQGTPETVTKSTLCNLVLKGSQGSTDIESEVIPDITDVTIVYDQVVGTDDFHNHTGNYNLNQPVPSWADMYTIVIDTAGTTSHGKPWSTVDLYFDYRDFLWFGFDGYTDPNFILNQGPDTYINYDYLRQFIENPAMLMQYLGLINSCDVVRIVEGWWNNDGWETETDYVFYLQNYYTKLSIKGLGNIQSAVESGTYYSKSLYWYLKQRLDNMSDNIAEYEEKALSNQVVGNGYLQSINTNIISIKDSIDAGVNSIVSAISGISGGSSSYSLPSLSTELQRLFIPNLTWQSIDFDDYMDSLGVLSLPFTFTNDVLTVADSSYSSTLDLHINDFSLDVTGSNDVLTIFEDQDYSFDPRSIFASDVWTMLTYLNAFALILGEAWVTYCHIFRRGIDNDC